MDFGGYRKFPSQKTEGIRVNNVASKTRGIRYRFIANIENIQVQGLTGNSILDHDSMMELQCTKQ